eukprot:scaffold10205_cov52-Cyclotella_meneghiniana.AAC.5
MTFSDVDKIDPLLTKLRITDGNTHIPPRSASKPTSSTLISSTNNNDIISRSQCRRENLLSSYNELKKYQRHDAAAEDKKEEVSEEYRGTSYRTRKLWDFDIAVKGEEESSPVPTARRIASTADGGLWSAKDVRREARESVTRQVQKDILEMEQMHEGMKKRMAQYGPSVSGKKVLDEVRQATIKAIEKAELRSDRSDEENTNINVIDDGYGKVVSPMKAQRNKGPYCGINEDDFLPNSNEEYVSTSAARLQRIRELNKQNYEHKLTNSTMDEVDERIEAKRSYESSDSVDEIMPTPPRYLRIIKERTFVGSESDEMKTNTSPLKTRQATASSKPPFSPPTTNPSATTRASQSPPKQQLTATNRQRSASPFNSRDEIAKARANVQSQPKQPLTATNQQRSASPFNSRDEIAKGRTYSQSPPRHPLTATNQQRSASPFNSRDETVNAKRNIQSPPRQRLTSTNMQRSASPFNPRNEIVKTRSYSQSNPRGQFSTPLSKSERRTNSGSPSTFYVSTKESESVSVKSGLSEGTSCHRSNNIVQSTLSVILSRIDEAKENFKKALSEGDIQKQAELADLITRLGEAAVTMRKLEGL